MTKKQKAVEILNKIAKSKNFYEIGQLREELDYILDKMDEDKVRAWLKKEQKENKTSSFTPQSVV